MSSNFGERIKISIFGQSHSEAIGVVIDGLPAGEEIDLEKVQAFMKRRAPGQHKYSTTRKEGDIPEVVSGLFEGKTCGAPLCAMIHNTNAHSKDYSNLVKTPRPRSCGLYGGSKVRWFSGLSGRRTFFRRLTAPLCFAGAVCMQILERRESTCAHIHSIHGIADTPHDPGGITAENWQK